MRLVVLRSLGYTCCEEVHASWSRWHCPRFGNAVQISSFYYDMIQLPTHPFRNELPHQERVLLLLCFLLLFNESCPPHTAIILTG